MDRFILSKTRLLFLNSSYVLQVASPFRLLLGVILVTDVINITWLFLHRVVSKKKSGF